MVRMQKFLFDTDFTPAAEIDEEERRERALKLAETETLEMTGNQAPPPPPPPTFTEEELDVAREEAHKVGYEAAMNEAEGATERLISLSLSAIAAQMQQLEKKQAEANDARVADSIDVARMIIRKMFPELTKKAGLEEIIGVIQECVSKIDKPIRVVVRVFPEAVEPLRARIDETAKNAGFEGKMIVSGDPRVAPGDCRIEWGEGGAERDTGRIADKIDDVIDHSRSDVKAVFKAEAVS